MKKLKKYLAVLSGSLIFSGLGMLFYSTLQNNAGNHSTTLVILAYLGFWFFITGTVLIFCWARVKIYLERSVKSEALKVFGLTQLKHQ